jgi:hypothetical protein
MKMGSHTKDYFFIEAPFNAVYQLLGLFIAPWRINQNNTLGGNRE